MVVVETIISVYLLSIIILKGSGTDSDHIESRVDVKGHSCKARTGS